MTQSTIKSPRRWLRFSLRSMLIVTTLICVGIVARQQYVWHRQQQLIHAWIAPLVAQAEACGGDITKYEDPPNPSVRPAGLSDKEVVPLLSYGMLELERPEERFAALSLLVELKERDTLPKARELVKKCRHRDLQAMLLHLISLEREPNDLALFEALLESPSPGVRAAAADAIGFLKEPYYGGIYRRQAWQIRLNTIPPVNAEPISRPDPQGLMQSLRGKSVNLDYPNRFPPELRDRLESVMLQGPTPEERTAAARALVSWPLEQYSLRVAEWGVWLDGDGKLEVTRSVLEDIPSFVHQTGNPLASLPINRVEEPVFITKPIVHLTVDRPLAIDMEVRIESGRPWYAFPHPDVLTVHLANPLRNLGSNETVCKLEPLQHRSLKNLFEGYPWIHPDDRESVNRVAGNASFHDVVTGIGLRWQSLIVSPKREVWMELSEVADKPQYRWWTDLREVPSSWVSSRGETERFLYYDGPTNAQAPVKAKLQDNQLTLKTGYLFSGNIGPKEFIAHDVLYVDTTGPTPRGVQLNSPALPDTEVVHNLANETWLTGDALEQALRDKVLERGFTAEETRGLLDSWRERFFQAPGKRLITLLTQNEYDRMCPLEIRPTPTKIVRVGIVLTEF